MFFKRRLIDRFAAELAAELLAGAAAAERQPRIDKANRAVVRALEKLHVRALEFVAAQRLGWFGRMQLGNAFQWALRDAGVAADAAREISVELMKGVGQR